MFKRPRLPPPRSATTSFTSDVSSVFSNTHLNLSHESLPVLTQDTVLTQTSMPDHNDLGFDTGLYKEPLNTSFEENIKSSSYEGGSSFDAALVEVIDRDPIIDENLSQDMKERAAISDDDVSKGELLARLKGVFRMCCCLILEPFMITANLSIAELPVSLRALPLCVSYEITRVFLHAGVSLNDFEYPQTLSLNDYDSLWRFLMSSHCSVGNPFLRGAAGKHGKLR